MYRVIFETNENCHPFGVVWTHVHKAGLSAIQVNEGRRKIRVRVRVK